MKKQILNLLAAVVFVAGSVTLIGCGNNDNHHKDGEHHEHADQAGAVYACPMKCEGDKTYDEAGTCPVCNMDLKQVEE